MTRVSIYDGPGVSSGSSYQLLGICKKHLPEAAICKATSGDLLRRGFIDADVFCMPGGADIPYDRMLRGRCNQIIIDFVKTGSTYIGICAGSYYASSHVQFALGSPIEVKEERELKFFPGIAQGPFAGPYEYGSLKGAKVLPLYQAGKKTLSSYYHGGGTFLDADKMPNTRVIATYDEAGRHAAIIECTVGKGRAILSGPHIEANIKSDHPDNRIALFKSLVYNH